MVPFFSGDIRSFARGYMYIYIYTKCKGLKVYQLETIPKPILCHLQGRQGIRVLRSYAAKDSDVTLQLLILDVFFDPSMRMEKGSIRKYSLKWWFHDGDLPWVE